MLGLITIDQVEAHRMRVHKHHKRVNRPHYDALALYDSPFGMDTAHGYGGTDQQKVEDKIDVGVDSSDGEQPENPDREGDFEPSNKMIEKAKKAYGLAQATSQEGSKKAKKHHKKALAETEE